MSEWKDFSLEELGDILNHKRIPLSSMERQQRKGKYPYFGASGIIDYVDDFLFDGEHVLISEDGENLKSRQTPIAFIANGKFWVNNHAHIIKGKSSNINKLLVYYFHNLDLNPYLTGAVQPKLNKAALVSIPISLPKDENEQTAIAEVLSSLDDKIDLLHRQNKTLEQLAETLFRQWFVEEAEEGWEVGKIEDVCKQISSGGTPPTRIEAYYNGDINWYSTKELNDNFLFESKSKITKEGLENSSAKIFPENTILIAIYAAPTVGRLGILTNEAACNQAACGFIVNEERVSFEYLYLHLYTSRQRLNDMASGSAQQNLNVRIMKEFEIVIPPIKAHENFRDQVRPMFKKIKSNTQQIRTLTQLRDTLLPKLMSGEVRVDAI
ncbi:MAG: restriction endonuclease subunit S [Candidatus Pollutiaquabacter aromativorans]